ncbi:Efflux transporter RND family MFP subunit protein [Salinisphaera shabanensis E1L3A]|uniref:Efflux transporter RND family MFP subunit protein n=1 Tax=Salinisphaera shabanensis E1L3A TaxID=1033802 RepID=U2EPK0_9GAMM|nr:efflux RND transporter periplasmic adaptor subunit [Salinisphaera shabanensis]ERJ19735.1 Efflux transporter RND family MFP subunit protein [Salinisphaera shabanensis E1L3A]
MHHPFPAHARRVSNGLRVSLMVVFAVALSACGGGGDGAGGQQGQQGQQQQPPMPVDVHTVIPHSVDIMSEYPGRVRGRRTVEVRARVEGILEKRFYNEGEIVNEGDMLFTIDPRPFQAVVNQRKAELSSAKASLNQAQRNWGRVRRLYDVDAVSEAERDDSLSQLETARASVQQAEANLDAAQIDLGYTKVKAPLTGVTSLRDVDEGALVSNGTQLTTITQLDPVQVLFALPEDDAIARNKAMAAMGAQSTSERTREATIILPNGDEFPAKGVVDFTQSTINPETGTVQLRAVVENTNNGLMPGRYVRARIRLDTRHNAVVVPNVAVSDGEQQTQVFIVGDDGKAKAVKVKLGPSVEEGRLVESGLSGGEQVIVSGLGQLKPGAAVKVKSDQGNESAGGKNEAGADGNNAQQEPVGESASAESQPSDKAVAGVEGRALRLSPREPLQQIDKPRSHTRTRPTYRTDDAYAANVGRGS